MTDATQPLAAMQEKIAEAADFMRLFSTPSRLMLLCHIAQKERSVGEIQADLEFRQPALSQQLAELRQAGLVRTRRASRQVYYSLADGRVEVVMQMLLRMFCGVDSPPQAAPAPAPACAPAASPRPIPAGGPPGEMAHWAKLEK